MSIMITLVIFILNILQIKKLITLNKIGKNAAGPRNSAVGTLGRAVWPVDKGPKMF